LHLLILWGVIALALTFLWAAPRLGLELGALKYAGVFGFIGAAFGVVLGMSTFFASQHYANLRDAAQSEATGIGQVVAMAGSFPPANHAAIARQVFCYTTEVVEQEWPQMSDHPDGLPVVYARERAVYLHLLRVGRGKPPPLPSNWYSNAVSSGLQAGQDHQRRLLLARPEIPGVMWILIYVGAFVIVLFAFFFHRTTKRELAGMMVAVTIMLTAIVGVLAGLDSPTEQPFALGPEAMEAEQRALAPTVHGDTSNPERFCRTVPVPTHSAIG
jgi:hypothetical protein